MNFKEVSDPKKPLSINGDPICVRLSFDRDATIKQALDLIELYKDAGIGKERVLIKVWVHHLDALSI